MAELAGTWIYRRFNPAFVKGNLTPQEDALTLAGDDVVFTLSPVRASPDPNLLEGTIEWPGRGLDSRILVLDIGKGSVRTPELLRSRRPDQQNEPPRFTFVATRRIATPN